MDFGIRFSFLLLRNKVKCGVQGGEWGGMVELGVESLALDKPTYIRA